MSNIILLVFLEDLLLMSYGETMESQKISEVSCRIFCKTVLYSFSFTFILGNLICQIIHCMFSLN